MKKISKVELTNFQSHKKTVIDKFEDFNVFLGPTDSGKSAIIRGIKWCLYNDPDGNEFIRQGETFAEVVVHFNNDTSIKRRKSKKENKYELFKNNVSILVLESFGSGPVQEVINFHGMREVNFFGKKQSLNICDQLSMPFFIANSSIERATMIGQLGKLNIIDRAVKNVTSDTKDKKSELRNYKDQLSEKQDNLKAYDNLALAEISINKMENLISLISDKIRKVDVVTSLKDSITKTQLRCLKINDILKFKDIIDTSVIGLENLISLNSKLNKVNSQSTALLVNLKRKEDLDKIIGQVSINDIDTCITGIESLVNKIRISCNINDIRRKIGIQSSKIAESKVKLDELKGKSEEIDKAVSYIDVQQTKLTDYMKASNKVSSIRDTIERKKKGETIIGDLKLKYDSIYKLYEKALTDSKTCPFCMSEVSPDKLETIRNAI